MAAAHHWHVRSSRARRDLGHGRNARRNLVNFAQRHVTRESLASGTVVYTVYLLLDVTVKV
jgi:hypothetical protein